MNSEWLLRRLQIVYSTQHAVYLAYERGRKNITDYLFLLNWSVCFQIQTDPRYIFTREPINGETVEYLFKTDNFIFSMEENSCCTLWVWIHFANDILHISSIAITYINQMSFTHKHLLNEMNFIHMQTERHSLSNQMKSNRK